MWDRLEQAHPLVGIVVANPFSGPGHAHERALAEQVRRSQAAGLIVLGYVSTAYGARRITDVVAEADCYRRWYSVDGIFFDEVASGCELVGYYSELAADVRASRRDARVVLNPGTNPQECLMGVTDVMLSFEGDYRTYVDDYDGPAWAPKYHPARVWHLIHGARTVAEMEQAVYLSRLRGAGWVYVTPQQLPNPWYTLPPQQYWERELEAVRWLGGQHGRR